MSRPRDFRFLIVGFLALATAGMAFASNGETILVHGMKIPAIRLETVRLKSGTIDQFAAAVGSQLRAYTKEHKVEACAMMCRAPNGEWGAIPLTINAHGACPIARLCPDGMEAVNESIHSHNVAGAYVARRADIIVVGVEGVGSTFHADNPDEFSPEDMASGAGYMVSPTRLWHYDGKYRVQEISQSAN
jgi:hypothetical protein